MLKATAVVLGEIMNAEYDEAPALTAAMLAFQQTRPPHSDC
jgi:hypothetical protein